MNIDFIKPTAAVSLADIARTMELDGKKVIKLQTGDPDFSTHSSIINAANNALKKGHTHYSFSQGLPKLRELIADSVASEILSPIKKEQVVITSGAVQAISAIISALIEPKDEVIIFEPNWPTVDSLVILMGGIPVKVNTLDDNADVVKLLDAVYSEKTKMIYFNSPNNPTGVVLSQDTIKEIADWAIKKDVYLIADEVYRYMQFVNKPSTSLMYLKRYAKYIFVDSFSKKFAMTGWRIGYCVGSESVIKRVAKASQITMTHVAPFIQFGAIEAMTNVESLEYAKKMLESYKERRNVILSICNELSIDFVHPDGAFYLFIKLPNDIDDQYFSKKLLDKSFVCTVPGTGFGNSGRGYVRISFANDLNQVAQGLELVKSAISDIDIY